jgi:chromosome segregation ATPase
MKTEIVEWLRGAAFVGVRNRGSATRFSDPPDSGNVAAADGEDAFPQGAVAASRYIAVRSDVERFALSLSNELSKFAALNSKAEAHRAQLEQRYAAISKEHTQVRDALKSAETQVATLTSEQVRLRKEISILVGKLDSAKTDLLVSLDKSAQARTRYETLEAEHSALDAECDRRGVSLASLRQEFADIAQNIEMARMQVEQGRQREMELIAHKLTLESETAALKSKNDELERQGVLDHEKIGRLVAVLDAARMELDTRSRQIADIQEEKELIAADRDALSARLDDCRDASKARIDAMTETKAALLAMSETQQAQIGEQVSRIAAIEAENATLQRKLAASTTQADRAGLQPCETATGANARRKLRRRPTDDAAEDMLVMPAPPLSCDSAKVQHARV